MLVVGHALPMAYVLGGATPRIDLLDYVAPYRLDRDRARGARSTRLEAWAAAPTW